MTREVADALRALAEAAHGLVDPTAFTAAIDAWEDPVWRVAVLGPTGVGKSTLVNRQLGRSARPTGLGGVTRSPAEEIARGVGWIDTPGLDGPWRDTLGDVPTRVDEVVWVVDGLQPLTRTERATLDRLVPAQMPMQIVISRADLLEPSDRRDVEARVRHLTAARGPGSLRALDLRGGADAPIAPLRTRSLRRAEAVETLTREVERACDAEPPPPDRAAIRRTVDATLRAHVRAGQEAAAPAVPRAMARTFTGTLRARHPALLGELASIAAPLGLEGPPELAPPPVHHGEHIAALPHGQRVVRALAADWLAAAQIAVADWLATEQVTEQALARRAELIAALEQLRRAMGCASSPSVTTW